MAFIVRMKIRDKIYLNNLAHLRSLTLCLYQRHLHRQVVNWYKAVIYDYVPFDIEQIIRQMF